MKKIYRSNKIDFDIEDERPKAIERAKEHLKQILETIPDEIVRYTWKAEDLSGFTITVTKKSKTVYCSHKYSKPRK